MPSDGARGRGADRLPLVGPKRDHAPLCARRSIGARPDSGQPAVLRRSAWRHFTDMPLGHRMPVLIHARDDERGALDALDAEISPVREARAARRGRSARAVPALKDDARHGIADRDGFRLDPHALLQGNLRQLRSRGGALHTGARVVEIERSGGLWTVATEQRASALAHRSWSTLQAPGPTRSRGLPASAAGPRAEAADDHHL